MQDKYENLAKMIKNSFTVISHYYYKICFEPPKNKSLSYESNLQVEENTLVISSKFVN